MAKQSPIQKLEALSSKRKQSALSLESQLNEANEALAAAVASQNTSTETELSASQNLKKATKKDKEIKKNLAYRFPVVREKYAKLITDAKTQDAMAKSDAASAKTALVSISKKIDTLKKKKEEAVKLSEETTKQFSDAIRLQEKTIDDLSKLSDTDDTGSYDSALKEMAVKTEIQKRSKKDPEFSVARERAQAAVATAKQEIGMAQKRKTSSLFKSVGRTRDKAVDSDVERHVLGDIGEQGTRVRAEEFAQANPQLFNENELEGSAAKELLEEAVQLSELALKATTSNADKIMGRLSYLEKVATDAGDDEVAKMILNIIKPLKKSVSKKTTFRAMLKKRFTDYVGSLPEMFARKIPLIGGLIGDFMQQKKEAKEDTKEYRESQLEGISKKGQIGSGLKFEKRGGRGEAQSPKQSTNDIMRGMGASPASESGILNGLGGAAGVGGGALSPSPSELTATTKSPIYEVLKNTYDKIVSIEELLHEAIDPEEDALRDAESASGVRDLGGKNKLDLGKKQSKSGGGGGGGGFFGGIFDGLIDSIAKIGKKKSELFDAAKAIAALGASLIPLAISLRIMKDVGFKTVGVLAASLVTLGLAGVILGKSKATMIQGALAIAALGAAMIPLAFALNLVKDVGFGTIALLAVSLVAFGIAAAVIGQPAVLPYILLGALGIAALGASLIPLAFALNLATPAIEAFGAVVSAVGQSISDILHAFIEFGNPLIGVGLLSAALGIGAVTVALIAFSAASAAMKIGGAAAGLVSGVLGFFSGGAPPSAIEMLALFAEFGKSAPLLEQAANAITKLADSLAYFSGIKEISTGNLEALSKVGQAASKIPASSTGSGAGAEGQFDLLSSSSLPTPAPSKEPVKGFFQSGRDWLTSKLFGSSETKTAEKKKDVTGAAVGLSAAAGIEPTKEAGSMMAGPATGLTAAAGIKKDPFEDGMYIGSPESPAEKKASLKIIQTKIEAELDFREKQGTSVGPNMSKSGHRIEQNGKVISEANSETEIGMPSRAMDMSIGMGASNIKHITDNDLQRRLAEIKKETATTGTIAPSSTPNTTVGQQVQKYNGEKSALEEETEKKASQVGSGGGGGGTSVVNAPTNTVVNNTTIQQSGGTRPNERTAMLMNRETATH